ncbi:ABC transporter substrate-binding protein [soil metagenome]
MVRQLSVLLLLILVSACQQSTIDSSGKTVFRYNESAGITSLDPAFANNQANIWACNQLYNGLVQLNQKLEPQPCIAKSWEISPDGTVYLFHLLTNIQFHKNQLFKGTRYISAGDFVFSFNRITDDKLASPGSWIFGAVSRDIHQKVNGFLALNDSTLQITLASPFPPFLGLLGSAYGAVVPFEVVNKFGKDFRKNPVGTGPFKFDRWIERSALILHKNSDYFEKDINGKSLPYLDAVMISFISDKQSAFLEFLKGKLDFISGLDVSYKDDLLTPTGLLRPKYKGKFRMETAPYLNTEYLGMLADSTLPLMKGNPLNNPKIRQAINYGFDRRKMITYLRNNMATPGEAGMVPVGTPGFELMADYGYHYDPAKTAQLLSDAGYPNGKGLPTITLSTTNSYQDLCEYMQGQLAESGIKINLEINQAAQHRQMVARQQLSFFRGSWIADYADAENYLSLFYSKNKAPAGPNYTHFSHKDYDQLYEKAMHLTNDSLRWIVYRQMDKLVMDQSPVVILYYDRVLRLTQNNIEGLRINPLNLLNLKTVRKNY